MVITVETAHKAFVVESSLQMKLMGSIQCEISLVMSKPLMTVITSVGQYCGMRKDNNERNSHIKSERLR